MAEPFDSGARAERYPSGAVEPRPRSVGTVWASALVLDVAIVSGVSLVLGLIQLATPSLWVDEAFTARAVRYPFPDYLLEQYHWLYYVLVKPWVAVAGTSEWALRLPSVVAAMAACALLVVLGRRLFDRWAALTGGLLLAANPFLVQWSQQARSYTLLVAVSVLATLLLLRALDRGTRGTWGAYGLALASVIVVQPVSLLVVVPAHAVLLAQERSRLTPHALLAVAVAGALAVPWTFVVAVWSSSFWLSAPSAGDAVGTVRDVSGALGLGVLLALLGVWVLVRRGRSDLALWLGVWAFAPFALAALVSIVKPVFLDRYLIAAAPGFALLAGVAIVGVTRRVRVPVVLATAAATVVGLVSWYSYDGRDNWRGENWSGAVDLVMERRTVEPVVVVPWWAHTAATYYGAPVSDTSTADRIWVLVWSESGHDVPEAIRRPLGFGSHELVEKHQFGWRVSAQLWQRRG